MAYTVLARKYRPQTFSDLVGQEHVTRTLSNAIRSERVAHAFLFTGVRGVGKTTTARIVAKALNCEKGPTPEPCGECDPCREITAGRDTDVIEMDGASNNSVEDVRRLQESIPYRPSRDRYKIVIVDEVHMLSTGAFNAFLKTLEEPPPHVKFIFATTESHKVPVTIRSRCQRYDFRLIPQGVVSGRVREILSSEGVDADDAAVAIVAREAAGSMRDALTLLDQIVAFGGETLVGEEVARVLGIADREMLHRVARAVLEGDGADALRSVDELADKGLDMLHFSRQLLDLVRDMVVLRVCGKDTDLVALVDEERTRACEVAERVEGAELQRAFSALSKVVDDVGMSGTPRTTLEMGLVRLATRPPLRPLAELVARLEELERRAGGGGGGGGGSRRGPAKSQSSGRAVSGASASAEAAPGEAAPASHAAPRELAPRETATRETATRETAPRETATRETAPRETATRETANHERTTHAAPPAAATQPAATTQPAPSAATPSSPPAPRPDTGPSASRATETPSAPRATASPSAPPPAARAGVNAPNGAPAPSAPTPTANAGAHGTNGHAKPEPTAPIRLGGAPNGDTRANWERMVSLLLDQKPALGAVLQHGAALDVSGERVLLAFPKGSFFGQQAEALDGRRAIANVAAELLGATPVVEVVYTDDAAIASTKTIAQEANERREARIVATRERALDHPLVHEIALHFNLPRERMAVRVELE